MPELICVLSKEQVHTLVSGLAEKISSDYEGQDLVLVGVLKGSFIFLADLARLINIPVEIDFIGASSYGSDTHSSGKVKITRDIGIDLKNRNVLLVEDIVDTGTTVSVLFDYIRSFGPRSVRLCTMIDKSERRTTDVLIDYACHKTTSGFLVGYGLDFNESYRNLPGIYHLIL